MARRFNGERGVYPVVSKTDGLIDDVFVAPLEPPVMPAQLLLDKGLQPGRRE